MKLSIARESYGFAYRLSPEADDPQEFGQQHNAKRRLTRVRDLFEVHLPPVFGTMHADAHAAALWLMLRPMIGSRLEVPFDVSEAFAAGMLRHHGVQFPRVDAALTPRKAPERPRPALLFSGGVDSLAAAMVMPRGTALLFLDRVPHFPPGQDVLNQEALIDPRQQRWLCNSLGRSGWAVHGVSTEHEHLYEPYPLHHSAGFHLPALYLADALGLGNVANGDVLCPRFFGGYHEGVTEWRFERGAADVLRSGADQPFELRLAGLALGYPVLGLTEIGTAAIVAASPFKGRATSCYFPSNGNYCLRCDKCFKKLLLEYVLAGREVPAALFEHFLAFPYLASIFARPVFDWHHVWYYLFQRLDCRHPLAVELHRQAVAGPDLSVFEKWYPPMADAIPSAWRDEVVERIQRTAAPMSADEQARFEGLTVPPLAAPADLLRPRVTVSLRAAPAPAALVAAPAAAAPTLPRPEARLAEIVVLASVQHLLTALDRAAPGSFSAPWRAEAQAIEEAVRVIVSAGGRLVLDCVPRGPLDALRPGHLVLPRALPADGQSAWRRVARLVATWLDPRAWRVDSDRIDPAEVIERAKGSEVQLRAEVALLRVARALRERFGYRASWPVATPAASVLVSLRGVQGPLDLSLEAQVEGVRGVAASRATAILHAADTPVDTPAKLAAVRLFAAGLSAVESGG